MNTPFQALGAAVFLSLFSIVCSADVTCIQGKDYTDDSAVEVKQVIQPKDFGTYLDNSDVE